MSQPTMSQVTYRSSTHIGRQRPHMNFHWDVLLTSGKFFEFLGRSQNFWDAFWTFGIFFWTSGKISQLLVKFSQLQGSSPNFKEVLRTSGKFWDLQGSFPNFLKFHRISNCLSEPQVGFPMIREVLQTSGYFIKLQKKSFELQESFLNFNEIATRN